MANSFRIKRTLNIPGSGSPTVAEIKTQLAAADSHKMTVFTLQNPDLHPQADGKSFHDPVTGVNIDLANGPGGDILISCADDAILQDQANRKRFMELALLSLNAFTGIPFTDITLDQATGPGFVLANLQAEFNAVKASTSFARPVVARGGIGAYIAPSVRPAFDLFGTLATGTNLNTLNAALRPDGITIVAPRGGNPDPNHEDNFYQLKHRVGTAERIVYITPDASFLGPKTALEAAPGVAAPVVPNDPAALKAEAAKILADIIVGIKAVIKMKELGQIPLNAFPYNAGTTGGATTAEGKQKYDAIRAIVDPGVLEFLHQSCPAEVNEELFQVQVKEAGKDVWRIAPQPQRPAYGRP